MTPETELDRMFAHVFPPIPAPISLADAALAEAHMNRHEAINGLCAEETNDEQ